MKAWQLLEEYIARFNEKFTIDDFKKVIDIKTKQWLNNTEFEKFLRPETLFGNKFEGYLNEGKTKEIDRSNKADACYKECGGNCAVSGTIRLYSFCDYCKKLKGK